MISLLQEIHGSARFLNSLGGNARVALAPQFVPIFASLVFLRELAGLYLTPQERCHQHLAQFLHASLVLDDHQRLPERTSSKFAAQFR